MVFWTSPYPIPARPVKLVLDISVGIKAIIPEEGSATAKKIRDDFRKGVHDLIAPDLYLAEGGNILTLAVQKGKIPQSDQYLVYLDLLRHAPVMHQSTGYLYRAYTIACQNRIAIYDAFYLAVSEQEGCPLLTADKNLIRDAPGFSYLTLADF